MSTGPSLARMLVLTLALALLASACGGSAAVVADDSTAEAQPSQPEQEPDEPEPADPPAEPEATAAPEPTAETEPTAEPEPETAAEPDLVFWGSDLDPGMCINRVEGNPPFEQPTVVPCDELHEEEIFAEMQLDFPPGAPYPGTDELVELIDTELCEQATREFAGVSSDLLPYPSFILYPLDEEWDAGDRNAFCSASPPEGVAAKIGSAAGGTITTDDVLVARAGLNDGDGDFDDWVVLTQGAGLDTMGTLTDGQIEIPLRRPAVTERGFLFGGAEGEGAEVHIWGLAWEDQDLTDLGPFDEGGELGTLALTDDGDTIVVSRLFEEGWDLSISAGDDFAPLVATAGDQRYPTFTPDGTQVVFHDEGDLWIVSTDGSGLRQLTTGEANDWESIVSPDGSTVVFASDRSGNDDLWAVSIDGGEPVNLTNHPADESWPVFSADGTKIYFSTDRFDPVDDRSRIMVMNADGSDPSFFTTTNAAQAVVVPAEVATAFVAAVPTLDERYNYDIIPSDGDGVDAWTHSSGRLIAELPAGWRVGEFAEGIGFIAGPRPALYYDTWEVDGVFVELFDGDSEEDFFARVDATDAVQLCEQFDGTGGIADVGPGLRGFAANHTCSETSVGGVLAFYNTETQVGVLIQGQTDGLPSREDDDVMITAIAETLTWG